MNDGYDENDLQAQQHADTKRRTDQLLERHKQRIQKLKVTTEETEGLKEKIRAKLEEHKNLMESSNNNNNSSSNENDYSQDYNDDIYDDDEYSNINQSMNSNASSVYAPIATAESPEVKFLSESYPIATFRFDVTSPACIAFLPIAML